MRKMVYRAGDLLQEMFYVYRENMFDKGIAKIEDKNGRMKLYELDLDRPIQSTLDLLEPFPHHLLIDHVLKDVASSYSEYTTVFKNPKRVLVIVLPTGSEDKNVYRHEIVVVTLKNTEERYVIDLAGAQYGYYDPVVPYNEYFSSRVASLERISPPGSMRQWTMRHSQGDGPKKNHLSAAIMEFNNSTSHVFLDITVRWETVCKKSVKMMLEASEDEFLKSKGLLVATLGKALVEVIEENKKYVDEQKRRAAQGKS
ncbi:hypothetical protein BDZ45DRAFT_800689 [Acephala macrosclerotiorum]|nr:hypothetical protein BDZ45DRAFT_800689 [Acephala macrosclerotiorum]